MKICAMILVTYFASWTLVGPLYSQTSETFFIEDAPRFSQANRLVFARQLIANDPSNDWASELSALLERASRSGEILGTNEFRQLSRTYQEESQNAFLGLSAQRGPLLDAFVRNLDLNTQSPAPAFEQSEPSFQEKTNLSAILALAYEKRDELSDGDRRELDQKILTLHRDIKQSSEQGTLLSEDLMSDLQSQSEDLESTPPQDPAGRAQAYAVYDAMYGHQDIGLRLQMLESGTGPYADLPEDKRRQMATTLKKQRKIATTVNTAHEAVGAGRDVTTFLYSVGVIDVDTYQEIETGLVLAEQGLSLIGAAATGNIFGVISGTAQILTTLFGKEPPPDPEAARHEQVMQSLSALMDGQKRIMTSLNRLSEQVNRIYFRLHDQTKRVSLMLEVTKNLLLESELQGLRDCRDYRLRSTHYSRRFFEESSGQWQQNLAMGYQDYDALQDQYQLVGGLLLDPCKSFLNNYSRDGSLTLLSMTGDDAEAQRIAQQLGRSVAWVKNFHLQETTRTAALLNIIETYFAAEYQDAILAAMLSPATSYASLNRKLDQLVVYENQDLGSLVTEHGLREDATEFYNSELLSEMVEAQSFIHPFGQLENVADHRLHSFADLYTAGFDSLASYGTTSESRFVHFMKPLRDFRKLLLQGMLQHGLYGGDVLIPFFSRLSMSIEAHGSLKRQQPALYRAVTKVLKSNPVLHENAFKYRVYQSFTENPVSEQAINIERIARLLKPEIARWYRGLVLDQYTLPEDFQDAYPGLMATSIDANDGVRDVNQDHVFVLNVYGGFRADRYELGAPHDTSLDPRLGANFYAVTSYHPHEPGEPYHYRVRLPGAKELATGKLSYLNTMDDLKASLRTLYGAWSDAYVSLSPAVTNSSYLQTLWAQSLLEVVSEPRP